MYFLKRCIYNSVANVLKNSDFIRRRNVFSIDKYSKERWREEMSNTDKNKFWTI